MRRVKLFIDASPLASPRTSGVGHSVYGIVAALTSDIAFTARYEIHLVAPYRGMKYVRTLNFPGVVYRPIPLPARVWNRLPGTPLMPPMDLLLGQGIYFLTNFRAWPLLYSKSITLIHDIAFRLFPDTLTPRHRSFLEGNVKRWIKRSTVIATVSQSAKSDIVQHMKVNPNRVEVLYNGVDTKQFYPRSSEEVSAVRAKYGLPAQYILFVGNLEPRKNLSRLITAYQALPHDLRNAYGLVLIGGSSWLDDGLDQQIAVAKAAGANIVRPRTYVADEDLPAVYSGARMLAWPPLHEGFGMPLLEAMATGVPVLTANNSSLPEVAGEAAYFVDAQSTEQITAGLQKVLTDEALRIRLIKAGHARAKKFSWSATARKLVSIADSLTKTASRSTMESQTTDNPFHTGPDA